MEKAASTSTRSKDIVWLIGHPRDKITGARLPSGRDVMRNFVFYHRNRKLTVAESAHQVYDQLLPFWIKSRLPVQHKPKIIQKIKGLHCQHAGLMKHRSRNNTKDQQNQKAYGEKLDNLFDISHANSDKLIKNDEDRQFLKLQQESRTGCIGPVDNKTFLREQRSAERKEQLLKRSASAAKEHCVQATVGVEEYADDESSQSSINSSTDEIVVKPETPSTNRRCKRLGVRSPRVSAVLDRTNTSVRTSTMILASMVNEIGCSTSSATLSKSTVHRQRQKFRREASKQIKDDFKPSKSVVHWDGKMLPDLTGALTEKVDRLPVLLSSLIDGSTKLLGVSKLPSGSGKAAMEAVLEYLKSWECDTLLIGMCFDTTASNTGRVNGACTLLETAIGRSLLWMACRHHIFEVLLSDAFGVCFGPSTGPEILFFKRFKEKWSSLLHCKPKPTATPLISADDKLKKFIVEQLQLSHPRDDYQEFLQLASLMVGLDMDISAKLRKPGALHRARWMAKAIYSMKIQLLIDGNESVIKLTATELQGIQRFNRFVVNVYLQSWFTSRVAVDAPYNDVQLIQRLDAYDDVALKTTGLKMMVRHSWYLSQELATLSLFSQKLSSEEKAHLVSTIKDDRGSHLIKSLPRTPWELCISRSFFKTVDIDDSFLNIPVEEWPESQSYKIALELLNNLVCVNDVAERGVALIQTFNATVTNDEVQKQYLLQVVEKHRKDFAKCNRANLLDIQN